ncbi:MAG TPA: SDR family NAD(P)-dependent oxidoreductase [Polyangiaceae bacterium]|jgi:NAD(P)-dependent dehydrogenase (short-subunit alcohol dehydrogenase family)
MQGKVIAVTGASAGIGAALAERVGRLGASVVLLARSESALRAVAARSGENALPIAADVTKRADLKAAFDAALARFGHLDVWVNNAGRGISRAPSELTDDDIDQMMLVNFKAALYGVQTVLPHFRERKRGQVINVSSMLGRVPLAAARAAYSASKAALNSLSASLRLELTAFPEIFVTTVSPGVVTTDFGLNALHGGVDNKQLPGAQSVDEVVDVLVRVIDKPEADVYTRDGARQLVADYYAAQDMGLAEKRPPFALPASRAQGQTEH